ncbi:protein-tyrosine phosphatase family protein [Pseudooceanicola aestuarii]|uniref:protein-tyrosine phosphatase family protein n=1 Tax=Pseudooceanicola aestuarii TaxID=2697319 RepID=UPI0013D4FF76|nr:hypothetical protein [Pseudooceanicola aestuarii]
MSGFPGLEIGVEGSAYISPEQLGETMAALAERGVARMVILAEEDELPAGAFADVQWVAQSRGVALEFLSIPDFSTPGTAFMTRWRDLSPALHSLLAQGGTFACACQYGAGRSGVLTAMILIEAGLPALAAIARLRQDFPEAVENSAQEDWLIAYAEELTTRQAAAR